MAYRRKSASSTRRTAGRKTTGRSTYRSRASTARGRSTARRSSGSRRAAPRTIRIVIEQPAANQVQRPPIGMVPAATPRKAAF